MRGRAGFPVLLVMGTAALLADCGKAPPPEVKPPPVVTLVMTASADQNPDVAGMAAPVAVRVFELTSTAKFERAEVFALIDHEHETLGSDEASSQEFILLPSEMRTQRFEPKPGVNAVGIAALYRDVDHAQWRAFAPVVANGPTKLAATIGRLAVTLRAVP
jgi:type VI secretion system protein VasD